jgi:recombination protein RecA
MFGNPETTAGGKALKYYASVRIEVRRVTSLKEGNDVSGIKVQAKIVKNKVAPPFRVAEFDIMFAEGISKEGGLLDVAVNFNLVKKSGSWYEYKGEKLGQGREAVKAYLKENTKKRDEIEKDIRDSLNKNHEVPLSVGATAVEDTSEPDTDE